MIYEFAFIDDKMKVRIMGEGELQCEAVVIIRWLTKVEIKIMKKIFSFQEVLLFEKK